MNKLCLSRLSFSRSNFASFRLGSILSQLLVLPDLHYVAFDNRFDSKIVTLVKSILLFISSDDALLVLSMGTSEIRVIIYSFEIILTGCNASWHTSACLRSLRIEFHKIR